MQKSWLSATSWLELLLTFETDRSRELPGQSAVWSRAQLRKIFGLWIWVPLILYCWWLSRNWLLQWTITSRSEYCFASSKVRLRFHFVWVGSISSLIKTQLTSSLVFIDKVILENISNSCALVLVCVLPLSSCLSTVNSMHELLLFKPFV